MNLNMSKYIDAESLKELLDGKYKEFTEKAKKDCPLQYQYMADGLEIAKQFVDSLQQEPIEKDKEIEKLIVRDIMEATIARINKGKVDKEKEENIMMEKIKYLRNLGLNEWDRIICNSICYWWHSLHSVNSYPQK